jgi:hypothetical protein
MRTVIENFRTADAAYGTAKDQRQDAVDALQETDEQAKLFLGRARY